MDSKSNVLTITPYVLRCEWGGCHTDKLFNKNIPYHWKNQISYFVKWSSFLIFFYVSSWRTIKSFFSNVLDWLLLNMFLEWSIVVGPYSLFFRHCSIYLFFAWDIAFVPGTGCSFGFFLFVFEIFDWLLLEQIVQNVDIGLDIIVYGYIVYFIVWLLFCLCNIVACFLILAIPLQILFDQF